MCFNTIYIAVTGTGDKQTGFCLNGNYFEASIDARKSSCEAFFRFTPLAQLAEAIGLSPIKSRFKSEREYHKISGFKRLFPDSLRVDKGIIKSRLCRHLTTCTMIMVYKQRVMAFFASCEQFRYSKRFDCWNGTNEYLNALHGQWL